MLLIVMAKITTKFPTALATLKQVEDWDRRADALYGGNKSKMLRELLDSKEVSAFFARKWREARKKFEGES